MVLGQHKFVETINCAEGSHSCAGLHLSTCSYAKVAKALTLIHSISSSNLSAFLEFF